MPVLIMTDARHPRCLQELIEKCSLKVSQSVILKATDEFTKVPGHLGVLV